MRDRSFLAIDLGASSGRILSGDIGCNLLQIKEISRFSNPMLKKGVYWYWDIFRLYKHIKRGLKTYVNEVGEVPESIGVDTWGVDFGLLDQNRKLIELPLAYRAPLIQGAMEEFFRLIPREDIYRKTGIQFLPFNTLFQLYALYRKGSPVLKSAKYLLFMPDLINFMFTGITRSEFTIATTSQLYDPVKHEWINLFLEQMELSPDILPEVVAPGVVLGPVLKDISSLLGGASLSLVNVASHDTASGIAAVPAEGKNWAYISSGTWSLMGVECQDPVITPTAMRMNFTNEGGLGNTYRLLKNITGFWLLEECRRVWGQCNSKSYAELLLAAAAARPFNSMIDPDHDSFLNPEDMPEAIRSYCRLTGQTEPGTEAAVVRCVLESLALKYRITLDKLRKISPHPIEKVYIIGGGSKNRLLCQFTANATGLPVLAGPAEATAIGNILVQAQASGLLSDVKEIRRLTARSFKQEVFQPQERDKWEKALKSLQDLLF